MRKLLPLVSIALLAPCFTFPASTQETSAVRPAQGADPKLVVAILSDAGNAEINAYLSRVTADVKRQWLPLVAGKERRRPASPEETVIGITIRSDGELAAMRLDDSTHNQALNEAAWLATSGTKYGPLPQGVKDPNLKLRLHFSLD